MGHDACRLLSAPGGWRLEGAAVFCDQGVPANLRYALDCDESWQTQTGLVEGWIGNQPVDYRIERARTGLWTLNGRDVPGLNGCHDLDLGFTPATNLTQLRRLALPIGAVQDVSVAWLDIASGTLERLRQSYERRDARTYRYEAPRFGYAADLQANDAGFVVDYPGLWKAEF